MSKKKSKPSSPGADEKRLDAILSEMQDICNKNHWSVVAHYESDKGEHTSLLCGSATHCLGLIQGLRLEANQKYGRPERPSSSEIQAAISKILPGAKVAEIDLRQ